MSSIAIKHLDLSCNLICDEGGESISKFIKMNKNMASLNISNNQMNNIIGSYLLEACKKNKNLVSIKMNFNSISLSYIEEINSICLKNLQFVKKVRLSEFKQIIKNMKINPQEISKINDEITRINFQIERHSKVIDALDKSFKEDMKSDNRGLGINEEEAKKNALKMNIISKDIIKIDNSINEMNGKFHKEEERIDDLISKVETSITNLNFSSKK